MSAKKKSDKPAPTPGHKCKGARLYVAVACECGWTSGKWGAGPGGRSSAYGEWHWHVEQCKKKPETA